MKLLFVIDNLGSGGAQRQMLTLALGLKARGHNVEFFVYYPENHFRPLLDNACIPVHIRLKFSRFAISPLVFLHALIKRGEYSLLLSFLDTPNFYAEMARIGVGETKLVVSERFMFPPGKLQLKLRFLQEFHRLADFITVNSHHQRMRMENEFPWMARKMRTIYNGYDLDAFSPVNSGKKAEDKLSLLAISSVSFKKNAVNLARALLICRDKYKLDVHIDWIGTQHVSDEGARSAKRTTEVLNEAGLSDRWNWLGERVDIPQMLASHDALIHPSLFEGLPNVVCEALACGRPVLSSHVGDHPILVQEGISGYLFDPTSPEDIARAIHTFSRLSASEREEMGRAARAFAEKHFSLTRFVDEYENLFQQILGISERFR